MSITAVTGPLVSFGQATAYDYNPELATSLFWGGTGVLDPRSFYTYEPGQNFGNITAGWLGTNRIIGVSGVPYTKSTTLLSGAAHITANTAMVLASSTTNGLATGVSITRADKNSTQAGLLMIDPPVSSVTANLTSGSNILTVTAATGVATSTGAFSASSSSYDRLAPGTVLTDATTAANIPTGAFLLPFGTLGTTGNGGLGTYVMSANATASATGDNVTALWTPSLPVVPLGSAGTIQMFAPQMMLSRAISITSTTSQVAGIVFTVNGFDVYNYPMTEQITTSGTSATTTNGLKAWKYILSVTPSATDGTGSYSVGTQDIIGFPIRSDSLFYSGNMEWDVSIAMNNAAITASTGYLAAIMTAPTATTGDVRGTYGLQTPSNGVLRVMTSHSPLVYGLNSPNIGVGLYGNPQYSSGTF